MNFDPMTERHQLNAIFSCDWERLFRNTDLIIGHDTMSKREFLMYGADDLRRISSSGETESLRVLKIEINQDTNELEILAAMVTHARGKCDYDQVCAAP